MNGLCYLIPQDLTKVNIVSLPIMVNGQRQTFTDTAGNGHFDWAYAGYGMDIHYTKKVSINHTKQVSTNHTKQVSISHIKYVTLVTLNM